MKLKSFIAASLISVFLTALVVTLALELPAGQVSSEYPGIELTPLRRLDYLYLLVLSGLPYSRNAFNIDPVNAPFTVKSVSFIFTDTVQNSVQQGSEDKIYESYGYKIDRGTGHLAIFVHIEPELLNSLSLSDKERRINGGFARAAQIYSDVSRDGFQKNALTFELAVDRKVRYVQNFFEGEKRITTIK